jgi:hypothetical protein
MAQEESAFVICRSHRPRLKIHPAGRPVNPTIENLLKSSRGTTYVDDLSPWSYRMSGFH